MDATTICDIITPVITIIGFVISYRMITKQKELAVQQQKNEWQREKLASIYEDILDMIEEIQLTVANLNIDTKKYHEREKRINNTIICYGTKNVVKIWNHYKFITYRCQDDKIELDVMQVMASLVLLVMQIKYDITDIKTPAKVLYVGFTTEKLKKTGFYSGSMEEVSKIVKLLHLPSFLKCKDKNIK